MNKVILVGRLGQDVEVKNLAQDATVANFSLATSKKFRNKTTGEMQEVTEWHRIVAWGKQGQNAARFLTKGSQCLVEGELRYRSYEKDGVKKYATDINAFNIKFLDSRREREGDPVAAQGVGAVAPQEDVGFEGDDPFA